MFSRRFLIFFASCFIGVSSSSDDLLLTPAQRQLADELLQSDVIHAYSDVFVQLGERLIELTSENDDNNKDDVIAEQQSQVKSHERSGKAEETNPNAAGDVITSGSSAWTTLQEFESNINKQKLTKPPGYVTRNGSLPVPLSSESLKRITDVLEKMAMKHKPKDRNDWETLNIYKKKPT